MKTLSAAVCCAAVVVHASALQSDPLAHYPLDGNVNDVSGNGNHGTLHGGTSTTDRFGFPGRAILFDGNDDYADIEQLLFDGDDATVAFWAKSAGTQKNEFSVMLSQGHGYDPKGFAFQYGWPSPDVTNFIWGGPGLSGWWLLNLGVDLNLDSTWHHFAMTKERNIIVAYRDGERIGTSSEGLVFGSYRFNIGRDTYNEDAGHRHFFGSIDDVYVYNTALNENDIKHIYEGSSAVSFAVFTPRAEFRLGPKANDDSYWVRGWLKLAKTSDGIDPLTEAVTIQVGPFSHTLPAGSFKQDGTSYLFKGSVGSSTLDMRITASSTPGGYSFKSCLKQVELAATTLRPEVLLTIGDDSGQATLDVGYAKFGTGKHGQNWVFPPAK